MTRDGIGGKDSLVRSNQAVEWLLKSRAAFVDSEAPEFSVKPAGGLEESAPLHHPPSHRMVT
jgi:hypothetical protein